MDEIINKQRLYEEGRKLLDHFISRGIHSNGDMIVIMESMIRYLNYRSNSHMRKDEKDPVYRDS